MNKLIMTLIIVFSISTFKTNASALNENFVNTLPDNYAELGLKEVGTAQFSVLFWDIYNSTLFTTSGNYNHSNSPKMFIFKIDYLRDISTEDLIERTVQQWEHLEIPEEKYNNFIPLLRQIWPEITAGDSLSMLIKNNQSAFYFNNVKVGVIEDDMFSRLFLDIWLSENTSQPDLRAQLLKGSNINESL